MDICSFVCLSVGPIGPGGGIYSIIDDVLCQAYFLKLRANQLWLYAILHLSVGPVGPGGGIYSRM